jgi:hypothetical protein
VLLRVIALQRRGVVWPWVNLVMRTAAKGLARYIAIGRHADVNCQDRAFTSEARLPSSPPRSTTSRHCDKMESNVPSELASTLQGASINRHPSIRHDLNPSTAASEKQPVTLDSHRDLDADSDLAEDEIPISVLNPVPRKQNMPPLPDLRFEQSYLKSIEQADSWQSVLWITLKDQVHSRHIIRHQHIGLHKQVIFCFAQGVIWTLLLSGWRHWNRSAKFSGQGVGARIRRWWWGVNNWKVPSRMKDTKLAKNVSEVSVAFLEVRHLGMLIIRRHTDGCRSTTKQSLRVRRRIERTHESIAFIGVSNQEPPSWAHIRILYYWQGHTNFTNEVTEHIRSWVTIANTS